MKIRIKYSLRLLLSLMVLVCVMLGILTSQNSRRYAQYASLQKQGVLLDTSLELGFWPTVTAKYFPAAFAEPDVAWIHFRDSGQYIQIGEEKHLKVGVKKILDKIISEARAAGFEQIRFSQISQTSGFYLHSNFDIRKLYPDVGDGKWWSTPEDQYPILMAVNRETLGVDR